MIKKYLTGSFEVFAPPLLTGAVLALHILLSAGAYAADDASARAAKLYEKHYYEEAVRLLRPELAGMDAARQGGASLLLGMTHLGNAKLYRELHQTATGIELDYLTLLGRQKTGVASRYVDFYRGQLLVETGKTAEGVSSLKRFAERAPDETARAHAEIELGLAYARQKQMQKAEQVWRSINAGKPELKAALAGAYALAGMKEHKPVAMAEAALHDLKMQGQVPSIRMVRNVLRAYSYGAAPDKALDLLNTVELKDASSVEGLGTSKMISFYDASLLDDLARINLGAAVMHLEKASHDAKAGDTATYFLAEAYLLQGNTEQSLRAVSAFLKLQNMPLKYRSAAQLIQARANSKAGHRAEAAAALQLVAESSAEDPSMLGEAVLACANTSEDCSKLEKQALAALDKGEGRKYFPLNAAVGKYYLLQKNYGKALLYMEAGRDKAYKNKIDVNDPLMLVGLAEAYYRNKKYSENLEIYFELGKQYQAVRQIQEAMQGIYAMEQQSAGDVKIF